MQDTHLKMDQFVNVGFIIIIKLHVFVYLCVCMHRAGTLARINIIPLKMFVMKAYRLNSVDIATVTCTHIFL